MTIIWTCDCCEELQTISKEYTWRPAFKRLCEDCYLELTEDEED